MFHDRQDELRVFLLELRDGAQLSGSNRNARIGQLATNPLDGEPSRAAIDPRPGSQSGHTFTNESTVEEKL